MTATAEADPGTTGTAGAAVVAAADRAEAWLGRVTETLPNGRARPQQATMARAVAAAVAGQRHLVVQAGTGTGKSLAYVVPALAAGKKVVVATATKALQDQLAQKDLPVAVEALPGDFSFAVLKGRSNYLCRQRAAEMEDAGGQPRPAGRQLSLVADPGPGAPAGVEQQLLAFDLGAGEPTRAVPPPVVQPVTGPVAGPVATGSPVPEPAVLADLGAAAELARLADAAEPADPTRATDGTRPAGPADQGDPGGLVDQVRRLLRWAEETETGDRGDLPFEPDQRAWSMVSVGPRECPGAFRCPSGGRCFAERARAEASAADVVVVNTHLYGAHLASGGAVLPEHEVVVFDEAHEVEEIMTACLGAEITPGRLRALQAMARPLVRDEAGQGTLAELGATADHLQRALEGRVGTRVLYVPPAGPDARAGGRWGEPAGRERSLPTGPGRPSARGTGPAGSAGAAPADGELVEVLERSTSLADRTLALLRRGTTGDLLAAGGEEADEGGGGSDGSRRARAVSAAGHLLEDLGRLSGRSDDEVAWVDGTVRAPVLRLSPIDVGPPLAEQLWGEVTAVLTSATVPQRLPERLGLDGFAVDEEDVGSPFDYRSHALLYVARHLPDRRRPESEAALHEELEALIEAAGGRTLALFTSRRATEAAAAHLAPRLPYRLLVQGELPKGRLLEAFAEDETSCLLATLGFWQGVDVPGRSLSLVTLDRLPFARPDDPLLQARRDRAGEAAFQLVDLPRAATLLAQGAGRLIRSAEDYGVVAVLDPRLATAGYRRVLLAGVPPMKRTTDLVEVQAFLARVLTESR